MLLKIRRINLFNSYTISVIFMVLSFISLITILLIIVWPYKILTVYKPLKIVTPEVVAGDNVFYEFSYCKYKDIEGELSKTLVDSIMINTITTKGNLPVGCHETVASMRIPKYVPSGEYYIKLVATYKVNFLRDVSIKYDTEKFRIINKEL